MAKTTLRVHNLAKELGVESKDVIDKCRAEGVELKNHMATVSVGLAESIREWFSAGDDVTTVEVAAHVDLNKVKKAPRRAAAGGAQDGEATRDDASHFETGSRSESTFEGAESSDEQEGVDVAVMEPPAAPPRSAPPTAGEEFTPTPSRFETERPAAKAAAPLDAPESPTMSPAIEPVEPAVVFAPPAPAPVAPPARIAAEAPPQSAPIQHGPANVPTPAPIAPPAHAAGLTPGGTASGGMTPGGMAPSGPGHAAPPHAAPGAAASNRPPIPMPRPPEPPRKPDGARAVGPQLVPAKAELKGPRVVRIEAPEVLAPPRPRPRPMGPGGPGGPGGAGGGPGRGPVTPGRNPISMPPPASLASKRKKSKAEEEAEAERRARNRQESELKDVDSKVKEWRDQDLLERQERLRSATGHGLAARRAAERRRKTGPGSAPAGGMRAPVEIEVPISAKSFCSEAGVPFGEVFKRVAAQLGRPITINEQLDAATVEMLAADLGLGLQIVKARTELEKLVDEVAARPREHEVIRAPIVTILGHVDHGKTSLLDRIRNTQVAAGEAGGITQHVGAYRVDRGDWHVTFLDTPGHAAFTAMRARGADVTDVVVLVVAANDGVQPQTIEAINHAKAAEVEIVVALNKIDLPGIDTNQVYGQLAEQGLVPSEWGGNTDVVKTSATTGLGVDELIAHLSQLSELMELKADPTVPAVATVLEAQMRVGQGNTATVLLREGTLKVGQNFVCGPASGRIRQLRNDKGRAVKEAGPGVPVEISGLDDLPRSGDTLYILDDLDRCKLIAKEIATQRRQASLRSVQSPRSTLEELLSNAGSQEVPQLGLILKADVQGSVDALKLEFGKIPSEKVRLNIKHAGVGAVNEADVDLAHVAGAIIVGFNVVADDRARRRADELGVEIRSYRIIYEIIADVEKALAGLLAPIEQEQRQGTVDVRKVFNVSKLGTIAGCFVRDGSVVRNHRVRLVRDGRIILQNAEIDSLKRFKDDAREVKAGLECGIKLVGFDDIKPGDEMQTYTVVQVAQKL